jgi:protein TonB
MNTLYVNNELTAIQSRTRKFTGASSVLHVLLFLGIYLMRTISLESEGLVEISWIEPADVIATAVKTTSPLQEKTRVRTSSEHKTTEHFARELIRAEVAPHPQNTRATKDKLNQRLVSLQRATVDKHVQIAAITTPGVVTKPVLAGITSEDTSPGKPKTLTRQSAIVSKPAELQRTPIFKSKPVIAKIQVPKVEPSPKPAKPTDSIAQRTMAGVSLIGPVANRPLLSYSRPVYPEWAKREGVEGSPSIYFVVLPNGQIKESVVVEKTSGFEDFDRNAIDALLTWRFEPLRGNRTGEQWGMITFHFQLNGSLSN